MDNVLTQLIWQLSKTALFLTDQNLEIQEAQGAPEILGLDSHCLGCSLLEIFPELLGSRHELEDILAGRSSELRIEYVNRESAHGTVRYLTIEDRPYRDPAGAIRGILHFVQDVTRSGELEQQVTQNRNQLQLLKERIEHQNVDLVAANMELRRLSELKSQFISVAAHELRTPLTSLSGYVEMLIDDEMGALTGQQRQVLEIVRKSAQRLISLTDDLLNAARLEAGQIDLVLQPVDLVRLVQEVVSEFAPRTRAKAQEVNLAFAPELPLALCDEIWARQIVSNLLSNANKFTPQNGCISIGVQLAEQKDYLQLSVTDTGVGISEQDRPHIFSRWFRAKNVSGINVQGSGLGLYITYSLVQLHNGSIRVESQAGQGSTFYITFPVAA